MCNLHKYYNMQKVNGNYNSITSITFSSEPVNVNILFKNCLKFTNSLENETLPQTEREKEKTKFANNF